MNNLPMIKLYNKERKYFIIRCYLYELLRNLKINILIVDNIEKNDESLYIILGGEFLLDIPKNYILYQCLPTSNLSLSRGLDAYWYSREYIELIKNAKYILDPSKENIKVFREFYNLENSIFIALNYQSCFLLDNYKSIYEVDDNSPIYLSKNKRSEKIHDLYKKKYKNLEVQRNHDYVELVKEIKKNKGVFFWINQYEQTTPDLEIIYLLRYNNIPCVMESSRDNDINQKCLSLGVVIESYIRIEKYFSDCLKKVKCNKIIPPKPSKPIFLLDQAVKNTLLKYEEPVIKNKNKMKLYDRLTIPSIDFEILPDGGITLKLGDISDDDLPMISLCTPTANRRFIFSIATFNFFNLIYPKNKLEWVILDDGDKTINDIIPNDKRIRYIYDNSEKLPVADKRNKLVELANHDIIVFMDDDDYYAPENLIARVKSLIKYREKGIRCVGCTEVVSFDMIKDQCAITSNGNDYLCESSLAFTRDFWKERKFKTATCTGEYKYFLEYRQDQLLTIPFQFVTCAITHKSNTTGKVRSLMENNQNQEECQKIKDILGEEFLVLLKNIKKFI